MHQEQSHKSNTPQSLSRAAAEHSGGSKATASFPAVTPIQRYSEDRFFDTDFRFSEDIKMAVEKNDAQLFLAELDVPVGEPVLNEIYRDEEDRIFKIGVDYIKDCGEYAQSLMFKLSGITKKESFKRNISNAQGDLSQSNPKTLYNKIQVISQADPDIGEAFYVLNNPADPLYGVNDGGHFNFHWGAVVAKSGSDVITAEADSNASDMWFQMYNSGRFGQSFKENWYTKGKLDAAAKELQVSYSKDVKQNIETIDLD